MSLSSVDYEVEKCTFRMCVRESLRPSARSTVVKGHAWAFGFFGFQGEHRGASPIGGACQRGPDPPPISRRASDLAARDRALASADPNSPPPPRLGCAHTVRTHTHTHTTSWGARLVGTRALRAHLGTSMRRAPRRRASCASVDTRMCREQGRAHLGLAPKTYAGRVR